MELASRFIVVFLLVSVFRGALSAAADNGIESVISKLNERIELLEARDATKDNKIAAMESKISDLNLKMSEMESKFEKKESQMRAEIHQLTKTLEQSHVDTSEVQHEVNDNKDQQNPSLPMPSRIRRQKSREIPDYETAFYATHTSHDIHHVGANQPLLFQNTITNIGNAYNNATGGFVAPVDGIYVLHATVMGIDTRHGSHIGAHINVDGTQYSRFWVTEYDQSSQMLVIALKAGQTVTVRNDQTDTGFVGQHFSTFSGFLLYEQYNTGIILG